MGVCNSNHPLEKCLQEIEAVLVKHGCNLVVAPCGHGIVLEYREKSGAATVQDVESGDNSPQLPRLLDSERLVVEE